MVRQVSIQKVQKMQLARYARLPSQQEQKKLKAKEEAAAPVETKQPLVTVDEADNPVGRLQEVCQGRLLPLPYYTFEGVCVDIPSARQFTCTVRLQEMVAKGVGKSKRQAKREAAADLLRQLLATPMTVTTTLAAASATSAKPPLDDAAFQGLRASKWLASAGRMGAEVGGLFRGVRNRKAGTALPPIEAPSQSPTSKRPSAGELLQELGSIHRFGVKFLRDAEKQAAADKPCRTVVKLSTMPSIVVVGTGADAADSREQACRAALEYLAELTSVNQTAACAGKK